MKKLEVGKKYRTPNGREVYIEAVVKYVRYPGYPFIGFFTSNGDSAGWFSGDGQCSDTVLWNLRPNTVKKEGWVIRYRWKNEGSPRSSVYIYAYPTKEDAEKQARTWDKQVQYSIHKIEWEEEET